MNRPRHNSPAFTLLELVLVMLIIGIIMAMAAPVLRGFASGSGSRDTVARIVALTHWARSQAVAEGKVYRLNFDIDARTYQLTVQEQADFVPLSTEFGRVFELPDQVSVSLSRVIHATSGNASPTLAQRNASNGASDTGNFITFRSDGRNEAIAITLVDRAGQETVISCQSPTEMFQVQSSAGERGR